MLPTFVVGDGSAVLVGSWCRGDKNVTDAATVMLDGLSEVSNAVNIVGDELVWALAARREAVHNGNHRGKCVSRFLELLHHRLDFCK